MLLINESDYQERKAAWFKEEYQKEEQRPNGMISSWGWSLRKEREFKRILAEQGIQLAPSSIG